jgi:hypothetical protein
MLRFVQVIREHRFHDPQLAKKLLLQYAENQNEQAALYALCGLDYIQAPTDEKWDTIYAAFIKPGGEIQVNFSAAIVRAVDMALRPVLNVKAENTAVLGKMSFPHGGGGYKRGGVGNYNLCTKALEETAKALSDELALGLATAKANTTIAKADKSRYADIGLSAAYEVLVGAFGAAKLTSWGMTARGRPPKKTLAQRLGLRR